jgi:hypothetical protein
LETRFRDFFHNVAKWISLKNELIWLTQKPNEKTEKKLELSSLRFV